jgi:hypothetical protein
LKAKQLLAISLIGIAVPAVAQHLWWHPKPSTTGYTCLYGEIEVLATGPSIYFCGCNWWPGAPAGGYTGIQDHGPRDAGGHNMIFSIWDTSKDLHPQTVFHDTGAVSNRFGGEGTGAHTHQDYDWKVGKTYRYFALKKQDSTGANTLCTVFFFDDSKRDWVKEATIACPNDGHVSVKTFGGGLNAFLENWSGRNKELPKVAKYRLWLGTSARDLTPVTEGGGDGIWGVLDGSFFLAEGEATALDAVLARRSVTRGDADHKRLTVEPKALSAQTLAELTRLEKG